MVAPVNLEDLVAAMEWVSSGESAGMDCTAYVNRATGVVYCIGEGIDDEPPDDLDDGNLYVAVPTKSELELGRSVALSFIEAHLPESYDVVRGFFGRRGAFSHFKGLLERTGHLEAWYRFEEGAVEKRLSEWCEEHGLETDSTQSDG